MQSFRVVGTMRYLPSAKSKLGTMLIGMVPKSFMEQEGKDFAET
jgi:hypothetical protein